MHARFSLLHNLHNDHAPNAHFWIISRCLLSDKQQNNKPHQTPMLPGIGKSLVS
jgi:hypothetical protein